MGTRKQLTSAESYALSGFSVQNAKFDSRFTLASAYEEIFEDFRDSIIRAFLLCCLITLTTVSLISAALGDDSIKQRADGCVVMDAAQAHGDNDQIEWTFDLTHSGSLTLQLIASLDDADFEPPTILQVDSKQHVGNWRKTYLIEEGLVWQCSLPIKFAESGPHTLKVQSDLPLKPLKLARLIPTGYIKSKIPISSSKYYDPWIAMHQSPEKQAALAWFRQSRFGMFIHWGVYSEAAGRWKGQEIEKGVKPFVAEWIMNAFKIPRQEYAKFAGNFNPEKSFATNIAKLAKDTGMKYVVITSKHHDGFALFDSDHSKFDIADSTDYQGDLVAELYDACRAEGLAFGVYYSHGNDWSEGGDGNFAKTKTRNDQFGVDTKAQGKNLWDPSPNSHADYLKNKAHPQIAELIQRLPELRLIWFDGQGLINEKQAFEFYKQVYELNPNIIVNRRVGYDFGDYVDAGDNKTPGESELAAKHFETCGTANHSWGFKAYDHSWKTSNQLLRNFVDIVSKGGNYLLNIGPDGKGRVPQPCVDSFHEMGQWVNLNADAIFGTTRWTTFSEGVTKIKNTPSKPDEFWFSAKENMVYAMSLVPAEGVVKILSLNQSAGQMKDLRLLGSEKSLKWKQTEKALEVDFTDIVTSANGYALEAKF